jgi:SOS-response transcriptional repressor LexA
MPRARENEQTVEQDAVVALRCIKESVEARGYPPSQREIAAACGWASASSSNTLLRIAPGIPRGIQITESGMVAMTETV